MPKNRKQKKKKKYFTGKERKQRAAQAANDFRRRMEIIADASGALDTFRSFPNEAIMHLLDNRIDGFYIEAPKKLGNDNIKAMHDFMLLELKNSTIQILPGGTPVSLYDLYTAGLTILFGLEHLVNKSFIDDNIINKFEVIRSCLHNGGSPEDVLADRYLVISLCNSSIKKGFYWAEIKMRFNEKRTPKFYNSILVQYKTAEFIQIEIDGFKRTAYRVGWAYSVTGMEWVSILPTDIGIDTSFTDMELPVYIQSHALQRMIERMDCFNSASFIHFLLFKSLEEVKIHQVDKSKFMIEFKYFKKKLGYLVCESRDGVILIRTFLFITNDGTPEGEKLKELMGLQKIDKKYWAIDKLSTFLNEDFKNNKKLRSIFEEVGCGGIFDIDPGATNGSIINNSIDDLLRFLVESKI